MPPCRNCREREGESHPLRRIRLRRNVKTGIVCVRAAGATVGLILERRHAAGGEDGGHEQAFRRSGTELENGFEGCSPRRGL